MVMVIATLWCCKYLHPNYHISYSFYLHRYGVVVVAPGGDMHVTLSGRMIVNNKLERM
jgi:hypothetical protein